MSDLVGARSGKGRGMADGQRTFLKRSKSANLAATSSFPKGFFLLGILAANCLLVYSLNSSCLWNVSAGWMGMCGLRNVRQTAV